MPQEVPAQSPTRWHEIARSPEFKRLESLRRRVTIAILSVFVVAVGAFLILSAYDRPFMRKSVDGGLTVAYVWLLSLTVLAWVLVLVYLSVAEGRLKDLVERTLVRRDEAREERSR